MFDSLVVLGQTLDDIQPSIGVARIAKPTRIFTSCRTRAVKNLNANIVLPIAGIGLACRRVAK